MTRIRAAATMAITTSILGGTAAGAAPAPGTSVFEVRPPEPTAVELTALGARGDGQADDSAAVQAAIDQATDTGASLVFVKAGAYRVTRSIDLWKGVRLIGYGAERPVFVVGAGTPAFAAQPDGKRVALFRFRDAKPRAGAAAVDAKNTTFCSALWNLNVRIESGNPGAAAANFHVAQGCFLTDCDFELADDAAGIDRIGNEISRCRFVGGQWALNAAGTSAGWQTTVLDCEFRGQKQAGIETRMGGITLLRTRFAQMPVAVRVPAGGTEFLYARDCRFEQVAAVLETHPETPPEVRVNLVDCAATETALLVRGARDLAEPGVIDYTQGLEVRSPGAAPGPGSAITVRTPIPASDVRALPPVKSWVNLREHGAVGDGKADDTAALRKAIAAGDAVYVPAGRYRLTEPVELKPATMLIGLHPRESALVLAANTPGFTDPEKPRAMVIAPAGGTNVVRGVGFEQGDNAGSVGLHWRAGAESMIDDVWFIWTPSQFRQYAGLWVDGGGGTFKNIWSPNNAARFGLLITDTAVPGRIYEASIEHQVHPNHCTLLRNVSGWRIAALQTEHNDPQLAAVEMEGCREVEFANLYLYRTSGSRAPAPVGLKLTACRDITVRGLRNFSLSRFPYEASVQDERGWAMGEKTAARVEYAGAPGR